MDTPDAKGIIPGQQRILFLSWLAYCLAYTLRVNIAVAIPFIVTARDITYTQIGLVTSLYFFTYMGGQLVNGYLGDRVSSKLMVITGLVISAFCNLGVVLAPSYLFLAIFWAINGLAQSMLWAPLMKTLSTWFYPRQLERVSFFMALSVIMGYALAWGASSIVATRLGWVYAFYIPAVLVLCFALFMIVLFQSEPENKPSFKTVSTKKSSETKEMKEEPLPLIQFLRQIRLPGLLLIALTQGIIREGISLWFPSLIAASGWFDADSPWLILFLVPIINFLGVLFIRRMNHFLMRDSLRTLLYTFAILSGTALVLNLVNLDTLFLPLLLILLLMSLTYGLTPILTSVIPFQYARFRRVSMTAGLIDCSIYMGAAIASVLSGWVVDHYSWHYLLLIWLFAALIGLCTAFFRIFIQKK